MAKATWENYAANHGSYGYDDAANECYAADGSYIASGCAVTGNVVAAMQVSFAEDPLRQW